jgi:peptidoglycan/LPS O-acetylase OafA/YrhL
MYHPIIMFLVYGVINNFSGFKKATIIYNFSVYFLIIGIVLLVSYLSYRFIEKKFLKIKDKKFN